MASFTFTREGRKPAMKNPFETTERRAFREAVRRFVETEITPFADEWDEAGGFPMELNEKAAQLGLYGFGIDERFGGLGFTDAFMSAAMSEEFARCGAGGIVASLFSSNISTTPIQQLANDEIRARVLPEIMSGRVQSCLAITEPSGGSDVASIRTKAHRDGESYVINGSKTFITGAMRGQYFVVGARTGGAGLGGISLFFVEKGTPGFTLTPLTRKMGWWASDQATLYFDDCRVPASHLMGQENRGFISIMQNFNGERLAMAAQCLGMSKVCMEEAIDWARQRQTFGKPLIEHQVIRHKIADMSARIDALEAYINQLCWLINEDEAPVAEISKIKFLSSKTVEFCANEAMQILGGAGYLRGNRVERIYREVKVMAIGGGSEEIMRDLAARQMGL